MRVLIISDIHSNLEALEAVFQDAEKQGPVDEVWCLGDVVGYGANPRECLALVRERAKVCLAGNHDLGACGRISLSMFNPYAAAACRWSGQQLSEEEKSFLGSLPSSLTLGELTLAHGSPRDPVWEYVVSERLALISFQHFATKYCLVGHSHLPFICSKHPDEERSPLYVLSQRQFVKLGEERLIINPGSVGQPRDGDPRSSYLLYDTDLTAIAHYRVDYEVARAQEKILKAGLPPMLADRLRYGQ